jgi:predicted ester cyclase
MATLEQDHKTIARRALEEVCARGDFAKAERFPDLEIEVVDQVVEGQRVASRWIARGTNRGRSASLNGITISHIEDGKIAEDWSYSDTLGLLRQLGAWRVMALLADQVRARLR